VADLSEGYDCPLLSVRDVMRRVCLIIPVLTLFTLPIDWIHVENNYRIGGFMLLGCFVSLGAFLGTFFWTNEDDEPKDDAAE
jgi:hypothetical protein